MHRFCRTCVFLISGLMSGPLVAQNSAPNTDDLPSAPSAVIQKKQAPPKKAAPDPPEPQSDTQQAPQTEPNAATPQASTEAPPRPSDADSQDSPTSAGDVGFRATVNEVPVVFTVTDKHNQYVRDL